MEAATRRLDREVGGVRGGRSSVALVRLSQPEMPDSLPGLDSGIKVLLLVVFSIEFRLT